MTRERFQLGSTRCAERPHEDRPEVKMGVLRITASRVGGLVALTSEVYLGAEVPLFRPFLLGALGLGALMGAVLWWRR